MFAISLMAVTILVVGIVPVFAQTSTITATIDGSEPTFDRFDFDCGSISNSPHYYRTLNLEITAPGDYSVDDVGSLDGNPSTADGYIGFFTLGGFDPASPLTNCVHTVDDFDIITFPSAGQYTVVFSTFATLTTGDVVYSLNGPGSLQNVTTRSENSSPPFVDGRINNWDPAAPLVLFGTDGEGGRGLMGYLPTDSGSVVFEVGPEQIAAVSDCPAENTLIAASGAYSLYRLKGCNFQFVAPSIDGTKTYVLIFSGLAPNTFIDSYER